MQDIISSYEPSVSQVDAAINAQVAQAGIWTITPDTAEMLLKVNDRNRSLRNANIKKMMNAMRQNTWRLTGDSIKLGTDGQLKDGQNRLHACCRSGAAFETYVLSGMDPDSFDAMDTGIGRNSRDIFSLSPTPIHYAAYVAGAAQWMAILSDGNPLTDRTTRTPQDLLDRFFNDWRGLDNSCTSTVMKLSKTHKQPVSLLIALHYLFSKADTQKADEFFEDWLNQTKGPIKRHAPIQLHLEIARRLTLMANIGGRIHDRDRLVLIVMAWNAFFDGKPLNDKDINCISVKSNAFWPGINGVTL